MVFRISKVNNKLEKDKIIELYSNAYYHIVELSVSIEINSNNPELDKYLSENNFNNWTIITAYNPQSVILSEKVNQGRNESLLEEIKKYHFLKTESASKENEEKWPIEHGYIVFDIDEELACNIGKIFNQRAIVFGYKNEGARIVDLASL